MDYQATIARVNESWRQTIATADKKAIKHIADKDNRGGLFLGFMTSAYYKRENLIAASEVLYAYVFKEFRQDQDESELRYPTWLLFSPSKEFEADPSLLKDAAMRIQEFCDSKPIRKDLRKFSYAITDHFADASYIEVPLEFTAGKLVYLSVIFHRTSTMPLFHLGLNLILAKQGISDEVLFFPSEYWSKEWMDYYLNKPIL